MHATHRFGHLIGATLLVAGTSMGIGMLALPVATAYAGFFPSLLIYGIVWFFMLCTGWLMLEVCTWMPNESNLITMTHQLLGKGGQVFCWITYLFLLFCLMVASIAAGGSTIAQLFGWGHSSWSSLLLYVLCLSPVVYLGTKWVDRLNLALMALLGIAFLLFIVSAASHIQPALLLERNWPAFWWGLPVIFTAFGYQILIPTLMTYLHRDVKKVRLSILLGTLIPLLFYAVWELLIDGVVPLKGVGGLEDALNKGENAVYSLQYFIKAPWLILVGHCFALLAITTTFIGISIAFVDFLADGLKLKKKGWSKLGICAIVFVIPLLISLANPAIFIQALNYAGGYGVALLTGALPIAMVWSGRYHRGYALLSKQLPGGKLVLSLLMGFVVAEILLDLI